MIGRPCPGEICGLGRLAVGLVTREEAEPGAAPDPAT